MFKVGDHVTQNDTFLKNWKGDIFHLKIIDIVNHVVYLDSCVLIYHKYILPQSEFRTNSLHEQYLKLDTQYNRKQKLEKLNNK